MKTYHTIKTLALGGIAMFSLASCSLDYEPLSEPSEITQGGQTRLLLMHSSNRSMSCSATVRSIPISTIF